MNKIILAVLLSLSVFIVGCDSDSGVIDRVKEYSGVSDVKMTNNGYTMYKLERGTVSCREHKRRSELACWKNGSEPVIIPIKEQISY